MTSTKGNWIEDDLPIFIYIVFEDGAQHFRSYVKTSSRVTSQQPLSRF